MNRTSLRPSPNAVLFPTFLLLAALLLAGQGCLMAEEAPAPQVKPLKSLQGVQETDQRMPANNKNGWGLEVAKNPDPALPRVLLIGDSILSGYRGGVAKGLAGKANVDVWITPVCQGAPNVFKQFNEVIEQAPYAVIHFNLGLHGYQKGRIPEGQYIPLTRKLVDQIRESAPQAKLIWASTTPIMLKGGDDVADPELNPIIVSHNAMAAGIMADCKIPIDDLYSLMLPKIALRAKKNGVGDMFHWTAPAQSLQAKSVVASIEKELAAPPK